MRALLWLLPACVFAAEPAKWQPYTRTEIATEFDASGNAKVEYRLLHAVNSSGVTVTVDLSPEAGGLRQIVDRGMNTVIDPRRRTATTAGRPLSPIPRAASCEDRWDFGGRRRLTVSYSARTIEGVSVDRYTLRTLELERRGEWWVAPSLDCALLREESYRGGRLIRRVDSSDIRLGDPDAALFEIPFYYTYTKIDRELR